ncbi:hypothetical protein F4806DRAFT_505769, partial [Annulohypoxylon nitens]
QNQRPNLNKRPTAASTKTTSPKQEDSGNRPIGTPDSSPQSSSDETQFVTDDPYGLDFEQWLQVHSTPALTEPAQLPQMVSARDLRMTESPNDFALSPLQLEQSLLGGREAYEALTFQFSGLNNIEAEKDGMAEHGLMVSESSWDPAKGEYFLNIFEQSMAQLHIVENCPLNCKMSRDLALLTSLVVEQLARSHRNLASDVTGGLGHLDGYPLGIFLESTHHLPGIQTTVALNTQKKQDIWIARIGTFEITDSFELRMIMKFLLHLKSQALNSYISRWIDEIKHYEMQDLEIDLRKIQEDLRNVAFLENDRI